MKNPPAFPQPDAMASDFTPTEMMGMTLRDYFAAAAMQGMFSCGPFESTIKDWMSKNVSTSAYQIADAMLKAREG